MNSQIQVTGDETIRVRADYFPKTEETRSEFFALNCYASGNGFSLLLKRSDMEALHAAIGFSLQDSAVKVPVGDTAGPLTTECVRCGSKCPACLSCGQQTDCRVCSPGQSLCDCGPLPERDMTQPLAYTDHVAGCSCGAPDCPEYQGDSGIDPYDLSGRS